MRLMDKPTLTGGLLVAGFWLLATPLPAAAEERRYDSAFDSIFYTQTLGSDRRHGDDQRRRYGHRDRPGSWAPNVEVIVDGISSDNRPARRESSSGPDRCHQTRSDSWSTNTLDCPDPTPPSRSQHWSSSP